MQKEEVDSGDGLQTVCINTEINSNKYQAQM